MLICCCLPTGVYRAAAVGARSSSAQRGPAQPGAQMQRPTLQCPAIEQSAVLLQRNGGGGRVKTYDAQAGPSPVRPLVQVDSRSIVGREETSSAQACQRDGQGQCDSSR